MLVRISSSHVKSDVPYIVTRIQNYKNDERNRVQYVYIEGKTP